MTESGRHGTLRSDGERCAVRFERLYDATRRGALGAITDPGAAAALARAHAALRPRRPARWSSRSATERRRARAAGCSTWDEPRVLEYEWRFAGEDDSIVRFELQPQESAPCSCSTTGGSAARRARGTAPAGTRISRRSAELVRLRGRGMDDSGSRRSCRTYRAQADELGWNRPRTSPVREALYSGDRAGAESAAEGSISTSSTRLRSGGSTARASFWTPTRTSGHALRRRLHAAPSRLLRRWRGRGSAARGTRRAARAPREASFARVRPLGRRSSPGTSRRPQILLEAGPTERRRLRRAPAATDRGGERERGTRTAPARARGYRVRVDLEPSTTPSPHSASRPSAPARCGSGRPAARPATRR